MSELTAEGGAPTPHWQHAVEALVGGMDGHGAWICPACYPPVRQVCSDVRGSGPCSDPRCACLADHRTPHHDELGRVIPTIKPATEEPTA